MTVQTGLRLVVDRALRLASFTFDPPKVPVVLKVRVVVPLGCVPRDVEIASVADVAPRCPAGAKVTNRAVLANRGLARVGVLP